MRLTSTNASGVERVDWLGQPSNGWHSRSLNSHGATVRLTVSAVISQSHGVGLISHGLLSVSTTDLPINMTGSFNRSSER